MSRLKCQFETVKCYLCGATRVRKYFDKLEPQYCLLKGQFNQLEQLATEYMEILESRLKRIEEDLNRKEMLQDTKELKKL